MRDRTHSTVVFLAAANVCGHGEGGPGLRVDDESTFKGTEGPFEVPHGLCGAAWMGTGWMSRMSTRREVRRCGGAEVSRKYVPMAIQTDSVASWVFAKRLLAARALGEREGPEGECATRPFVGAGIAGIAGWLAGREVGTAASSNSKGK